ncbi:MAG: DJ-1/PfpI family protein [Candidatus Omnitrophica bacterium]|nr:DJ-1/PfpI family protein [Candidatus Omnitrophota bacterium]
MKKAVMIIAQNQFKEEELFQPKQILEDAGIEVQVASVTLDLARGVENRTFQPQIMVKDINVNDFDAIIFVGGAGAIQYWNDPVAHKIARDAYSGNKVVAAICVAPVILAKAGILKDKRATVWSSDSGQLLVAGAKYSGANVEKDGKIITAAGPFAAREFGEELVKAILY